jgi:hypothetical protein
MSLSLNRKRSRLALEEEEDEQRYRDEDATSGSTADLKRTRTQGELEEIAVIAPGDAWHVDVDSILSSPTLPPSSGGKPPQSNVSRHAKGSSIIVLCVQGNMHLHYDLLWYVATAASAEFCSCLRQCHAPRTPRSLAIIAGFCSLSRSVFTCSLDYYPVLVASDTRPWARLQSLPPPRSLTSPGRRAIPARRARGPGHQGQTAASATVWLGWRAACRNACWQRRTENPYGIVEELRRHSSQGRLGV